MISLYRIRQTLLTNFDRASRIGISPYAKRQTPNACFILHPSSFILLAFILTAACSKPPQPPSPPPKPPEPVHTAAIPAPPHEGWAPLLVKIVDLDGRPLPGAAPVAVSLPNAFEKPVAVGEPANQNGDAVLFVPPDKRLYVRGWDFTLSLFANNFYDVLPGPVTEPGVMQLVMVPAGAITAQLVNPDGTPAANAEVGLMMYHPIQGPWWPSQATSDQTGAVVFAPIPAGIYTLKLKTESGAAQTPQITIQPAGMQDLGRVRLLPQPATK